MTVETKIGHFDGRAPDRTVRIVAVRVVRYVAGGDAAAARRDRRIAEPVAVRVAVRDDGSLTIAGVTDSVVIGVRLIGVGNRGTIVDAVRDAVPVAVGVRHVAAADARSCLRRIERTRIQAIRSAVAVAVRCVRGRDYGLYTSVARVDDDDLAQAGERDTGRVGELSVRSAMAPERRQERAARREDLDPRAGRVRNRDPTRAVHSRAQRILKLAGAGAVGPELEEERPGRVEHLNAAVPGVGDDHSPRSIHGDAGGTGELPRTGAGAPEVEQVAPRGVERLNPVVPGVGDDDASERADRDTLR